MDKDWLQTLKVGDEVVIAGGSYGKTLGFVSRITATQIVLKSGSKFRRSDGEQIGKGDSWYYVRLVQPTPEIKAQVRKGMLVEQLTRFNYRACDNETLEAIYAELQKVPVPSLER